MVLPSTTGPLSLCHTVSDKTCLTLWCYPVLLVPSVSHSMVLPSTVGPLCVTLYGVTQYYWSSLCHTLWCYPVLLVPSVSHSMVLPSTTGPLCVTLYGVTQYCWSSLCLSIRQDLPLCIEL
ncbi:hypothetical protein Ahia01_000846200, partial [Argonauta hians]